MPVWAIIYFALFIFANLFNIFYMLQHTTKRIFLMYDSMAWLFLLLLSASYWIRAFSTHISVLTLLTYILIVAIDIYISVWGDLKTIGVEIPEALTEDEVEAANILSLIFASPVYVIAGSVCLNSFIRIFHIQTG